MLYEMSAEEKAYLDTYRIEDFARPSIATDIAVFTIATKEAEDSRQLPVRKLQVLLINRANFPYKGSWALPGGFCQPDEEVYETARRELYEETNIKDAYLNVSGVYGEIGRDPRGWIISHAFLSLVDGTKCSLRADADAWDAKWFNLDIQKELVSESCNQDVIQVENKYILRLENEGLTLVSEILERKEYRNYHEMITYQIVKSEGLGFDHAKIILNAFQKLQSHAEHDEKIVFDLMPEKFTLTELQTVFEIILQKELVKPNFRRKIADYVIETEEEVSGHRFRNAKQFIRNVKRFYDME